MKERFKKELHFYYTHIFDTHYKMGIKQYKNQSLYISMISFIPLFLFVLYVLVFRDESYLHSDAFYNLKLSEQDRLNAENHFYLSLALIAATFLIKLFLVPIEIKRANFKGVNWKVRIVLLIIAFMFLIGWSIYRLQQPKPYFIHEIIFGTVLINMIFGNNRFETEAEKERYKVDGRHI
ncbi:hypothetical protein ACMGE6_08840 [Macrococcus equi]|uniref:hypothetical protein n=1 Tax=Macrococcus equi TaxID=3395462 RepID=UPI0039BE5DD4